MTTGRINQVTTLKNGNSPKLFKKKRILREPHSTTKRIASSFQGMPNKKKEKERKTNFLPLFS
jgi:hypothetical protein